MRAAHCIHLLCAFITYATAQTISDGDGYTGYNLSISGDGDSTSYETDNTDTSPNDSLTPPDVFLNASVSVGEIDITVKNLTAKINIDAQVLSLLQFNAGVDLSINRVALTIQNVSAKVILEARLENLLLMINDTLNSIDLNPIIATLGQDLGQLVNTTVGGLTGSSTNDLNARGFNLDEGILYSINDYTGNAHTNRVLTQSGEIVDQSLHNDGSVFSQVVVGDFSHDMTFTGQERTLLYNGENVKGLEYSYSPFPGLITVAEIYIDMNNNVVGTRVLSEIEAGGSSTISNDSLVTE